MAELETLQEEVSQARHPLPPLPQHPLLCLRQPQKLLSGEGDPRVPIMWERLLRSHHCM